MKTTVNFTDFKVAFQSLRPDNFTDDGLRALFDYLEDYEDDTGLQLELDVIALCCDFTEYSDFSEFEQDYANYQGQYGEDWEALIDYTIVIPLDNGGAIIQVF